MKFLQKLGKALMLPVAILPICGILMGIGYRLCPATMQGGDIEGAVNLIGLFLVKAGGALIDNMAILFAIGVGVGMSEKNDGTGGIAALASWLMMKTLLATGFVTTIMPSIADSATKTLAFDKIENPFIGILAGIIGSMCYNRFKNTKLPDWLAFFSGKRCVAIIAGVVSILASVVLLFVWPLLFGALVALGKGIVGLDVVGAGIYAFLNRLLIPTGLHHALNNVFWFDTIGLGDLQHFWAGETSADVSWSLGMYMSGFFPCMMFGIPGAALAMVKCAKPGKKKVAIGLVASAAICAFICGVTEPFEFGFMFLAPVLYVIYAALYGIFTMITVALGFRAGFSFSAGAMDLFFSSSLPAAAKIWLIIPLGIAAFLVFYFVFLFAIKKFDLKTPGREDDDDLEAEKNVELASDDFTAIAAKILETLEISFYTYTKSIGPVKIESFDAEEISKNAFYMPDAKAAEAAGAYLEECMKNQDSAGGIIECRIKNVPAGLGNPVFEKLDAVLAEAVMSIGAVKAVEIGDGIQVSAMKGSEDNDGFHMENGQITKNSNHAGGIMGGMSDGSEIILRAAIKPTPSISQPQNTVTDSGEETSLEIHGRHDPVIVPRAVVVVESMCALAIVDALFSNMTSQMDRIQEFYQK